ncbi:MAG TPA: transposase [Chitinophagaceae bacterium]|nr:transposase [Chitinophagaceae bacterium]
MSVLNFDTLSSHFFHFFSVHFPFGQAIRSFSFIERITMGEGGYKIRNRAAIHFITFAVVEWVDVFTRKIYSDILLDSIRHCQAKKGLELYAWCLMTSHLHLVASAKNSDLSEILRDFKKYTSKQITSAIENNQKESRRNWMLAIFKQQGEKNSRNSKYQFWRQDNRPKELYSAAFSAQKINYIHNNPVVAGIVDRAEDYVHSSARDYFYQKKCGLLDVFFL